MEAWSGGIVKPGPRLPSYVPPREWRQLEIDEFLSVRPVSVAQHQLFDGATSRRPTTTCFVAGDLSVARSPRCVSVVGTRAVSEAGAARARRLGRELAQAGVVVVSGLAAGVDTHALTAAIEAGGRVIAVIGTPLEKAFPAENKGLQELIYREHLLVSPFPAGSVVQKSFFPIRNRVMAAISDATAIIEASDTSGTLHQAAECQRLGRWLFIASTVASDPKLTWPRRFLGQPRTALLATTEDILTRLSGAQ